MNLGAVRWKKIPLINRHLGVCVAWDSPSKTAISGYAGLLQSLRSNVVGPHTHSRRFPWDVGLQVGGAQKHLRSGSNLCRHQVRAQRSLAQHRWWVPRPTTLERSDWRREACPPAERAQQRSDEPTRRNQKDAKKNWNLTPINCPITAAASARCAPPTGGGWRRVCSGRR